MTKREVIKDMRKEAKRLGLTFKNNSFYIRYTDKCIFKDTFDMCYENLCSGYIESLVK